eukprot:Selendium_serpulae@DN4771_c0_g1_i3.p1
MTNSQLAIVPMAPIVRGYLHPNEQGDGCEGWLGSDLGSFVPPEAPNSPYSYSTCTTQSTDGGRDKDRRPYFEGEYWWWQPDSGSPARGICRRAPKKKNRLILEFSFNGGNKSKKYYRCELCFAERNVTEWVFHKNYVHQHIPRHHKEHCDFCVHCRQLIYNEVYAIHVKTCCERVKKIGDNLLQKKANREKRKRSEMLVPYNSGNYELIGANSPSDYLS